MKWLHCLPSLSTKVSSMAKFLPTGAMVIYTSQDTSYRPISLTSVCSKIMEHHIIYSSVCKHVEYRGILTPRQHGFRPGFFCETQLVSCINDWAKSWDRCFRTDIAIFVFSKAFDSVPHCRLLVNSTNTVYVVLCKTGSTQFYLIGMKE